MIEATCLFCKLQLIDIGATSSYNNNEYKTISHTRRCNRCMVTQSFTPEGRPTCYSFEVLPYILMFDLIDNKFTIRERSNMANIILKCDAIPHHLTPKNTTLDKVKTLILFS